MENREKSQLGRGELRHNEPDGARKSDNNCCLSFSSQKRDFTLHLRMFVESENFDCRRHLAFSPLEIFHVRLLTPTGP